MHSIPVLRSLIVSWITPAAVVLICELAEFENVLSRSHIVTFGHSRLGVLSFKRTNFAEGILFKPLLLLCSHSMFLRWNVSGMSNSWPWIIPYKRCLMMSLQMTTGNWPIRLQSLYTLSWLQSGVIWDMSVRVLWPSLRRWLLLGIMRNWVLMVQFRYTMHVLSNTYRIFLLSKRDMVWRCSFGAQKRLVKVTEVRRFFLRVIVIILPRYTLFLNSSFNIWSWGWVVEWDRVVGLSFVKRMILVSSLTGATSLSILNFNNLLVHILKFIGIIDRRFFVIGLITESRKE